MINLNKNIIAIGIFFISLFVYLITLSPTVSFTDNGELAGVAYSLGIAHSSGYPLLAIISHFWGLIPFGWTYIYQLNLLSALFASGAVITFYLTARLLINNIDLVKFEKSENKKKRKSDDEKKLVIIESSVKNSMVTEIIAISLALTLAFSSLVWEQAVVFEVYSLQFLLINLSFYFLFNALIKNEDNEINYVVSGLFVGLSFANHLTTILIIPALIYIYFKKPGTKLDLSLDTFSKMMLISVFILAGGLFYLYLPVRSAAEPDFNWGYVHRSVDKFLYHVQGKQYQVWMFSGMSIAFENFGKFIEKIPYNLGFIGLIPFTLGFIRLRNSLREYFWFFIILALTCILYSVNYSIHDIDVYFYLAIYSFIMISGAGLVFIAERFEKFKYIAVLLPLVNISINFTENDKSENYLVYDYTRNVVDNLGENAVIISAQWDYWNSAFWYLQKVENYRPDVVLIERELLRRTWYPLQLAKWYPEISSQCSESIHKYMVDLEKFESGMEPSLFPDIQNNYVNMLKCFIESNIDKRPVYVTFDFMNSGADAEPLKDYNIVPAGFAFKLEKKQLPFKVNMDKLYLERFINYSKDTKHHLEKGILESASINMANIGRYSLATGDRETAQIAFEKALAIYPDNPIAIQGMKGLGN